MCLGVISFWRGPLSSPWWQFSFQREEKNIAEKHFWKQSGWIMNKGSNEKINPWEPRKETIFIHLKSSSIMCIKVTSKGYLSNATMFHKACAKNFIHISSLMGSKWIIDIISIIQKKKMKGKNFTKAQGLYFNSLKCEYYIKIIAPTSWLMRAAWNKAYKEVCTGENLIIVSCYYNYYYVINGKFWNQYSCS